MPFVNQHGFGGLCRRKLVYAGTMKTLLGAGFLTVSLAFIGCFSIGNTSGVCSKGESCACDGIGNCDHSCDTGSCAYECAGTGNCTLTCDKGGCTATSNGTGNTNFDCKGNGCTLTCEGEGNCNLTGCTQNCTVICKNTGNCTSSCTDASCKKM
jgi:hypothetical protein